MNVIGTREDVRTLLHEAGHAFHVFESHVQPLLWQDASPYDGIPIRAVALAGRQLLRYGLPPDMLVLQALYARNVLRNSPVKSGSCAGPSLRHGRRDV